MSDAFRHEDDIASGLGEFLRPDTLALYRQAAAERAVTWVESGMVVGLGTGATAAYAIRRIGLLLENGTLRNIVAVPTSVAAESEARRCAIPLADADWDRSIDVTIDGADEVDPSLNLVKGAGGALLREKIVAQASDREIIVVDETKLSLMLGTNKALPVEVVPFGWRSQAKFLESLGGQVILRSHADGAPFRTDQENLILDCAFGPIAQAVQLAAMLDERAGIVAHGLFLGSTSDVIVAGARGVVRRVRHGRAHLPA